MDGFCIIFIPSDRSWIGTPDFIRGVASLFDAQTFESLRITRTAPVPAGVESPLDESTEQLLNRIDVPVEDAIALQRTGVGCSTTMWLGDSPLIKTMATEVMAALSGLLAVCWPPVEASIENGRWVHYNYNDGEYMAGGLCRVTLYDFLGYPVPLDKYLIEFLKLSSVVRFGQRLEELSFQPWSALIDLV